MNKYIMSGVRHRVAVVVVEVTKVRTELVRRNREKFKGLAVL